MPFVLYYRDLDGIVTGSNECSDEFDIVEAAKNWAPDTSAIKVDEIPDKATGNEFKVVNGVLTEVADPDFNAQEPDRDSGLAKIKLVCVLTDKEMQAVFGG